VDQDWLVSLDIWTRTTGFSWMDWNYLVVFMDKDMAAINWFFYAYWILGSMGTVKNEPGKF
jgi:hypothetical protein